MSSLSADQNNDTKGLFVEMRRIGVTSLLIQSPSLVPLLGLSSWAEVGGIASTLCSKAFLPPPIST